MELNNREIALLVWVGIPITLMFVKSKAWRLVLNVLRSLFARGLRLPLLVVLAYGSACVIALSEANLWSLLDLKSTLYWGAGFLLVSTYRAMRSPEQLEVGSIIKALFGTTVVVEYVAEYQTFPLWIELLLTPVLLLAVLVAGMAKDHQERAKRFAEGALIVFGIVVLSHGIFAIASEWRGFISLRTAADFSIPIILSLMSLPLLVSLAAYAAYQTAFMLVRLHVKDAGLQRHARRSAALAFRFDLRALRRWQVYIAQTRPSTKSAIDEGIRLVVRSGRRARLGRRIPPPFGWDPYEASAYLEPSLPAGEYRCYDEYWASSTSAPSEVIGLENSMMYRVEGGEFAANKLSLSLFIGDKTSAESARTVFSDAASGLLMKLLSWKRLQAEELTLAANQEVVVGNVRLKLEVEEYPTADRINLIVAPIA